MSWTADELRAIGDSAELDLASRRVDGTLRSFVTIWSVRSGDEIFVRSQAGPGNPWFRRALASGEGRIRAGGVEQDVRFELVPASESDPIDGAYRAKYGRYESIDVLVGALARTSTLRLVPYER